MTWQELLKTKRVQRHKTSNNELDGLRAVIERDLRDASLPGLSEDRRFATAYNCVLQLAKMAIACAGYRVTAKQGHHENTFVALELAVGPPVAKLAKYFNTCRRKRNLVVTTSPTSLKQQYFDLVSADCSPSALDPLTKTAKHQLEAMLCFPLELNGVSFVYAEY